MKIHIFTALLFSFISVQAQQVLSPEIKASDLKKSIYYLASDSLTGRFPGTKGGNVAADYIASSFRNAGLSLYQKSGRQYFDLLTRQEVGKKNTLQIDGVKYKLNKDFVPFPVSADGKAEGPIVFAGFGFDIKNDSFQWNDYANIDAKGKIVMLLRGAPDLDKYRIPGNYSDDIVKAIVARDKGAVAVLFVSGKKYDDTERFPGMNLRESPAGIPVLQLKKEIADKILKYSGKSIDAFEEQFFTEMKPAGMELKSKAALSSEIIKIKAKTSNVVGFLYASDTTKTKSYVVIGAHYDHLGMGGSGSSSRIQDTTAVHNGADDNASGVAAMLEIAGKINQEKSKLKQNVIFIAFGAEEMGILGSKYFLEQAPVPASAIKAMINLDMVGRLKEDTLLQVNGTGTSKESVSILNEINKSYNFNLRMSPEGYGPSDHAAFYAKNIPVFFISTGAHTDYHTPFDDRDKINYPGLEKVSKFTYELLGQMAFSEEKLTFQEAGPQQATTSGRRFRVTLGIMPDVNNTTDKGLLVEFVTKGKPAYNGGMLKGDIIISVDGKPVRNIQDYMVRLSQLKAGQSVNVEVLRNDKTELLIIQL